MNRKLLWVVLVIGVGLIVAPIAMGLPGKAAAGERMLGDFQPIMQPANVQTTADYYYDVFVPLGNVVPAMSEQNIAKFGGYVKGFGAVQTDAAKLIPMLAQALGMTQAQVQAMLAKETPAMAQMLKALPQMNKDFTGFVGLMQANVGIFSRVPAGLDHYKPLVDTMQGNVADYEDVNSLPNFNLFAWFFIVPGILLVLISGTTLFAPTARKLTIHGPRPTPAH